MGCIKCKQEEGGGAGDMEGRKHEQSVSKAKEETREGERYNIQCIKSNYETVSEKCHVSVGKTVIRFYGTDTARLYASLCSHPIGYYAMSE